MSTENSDRPLWAETARSLWSTLATLFVLGLVTFAAWSRYQPAVSQLPLTIDRITVNQAPPWIGTSVAQEVAQRSDLERHHLAEQDLVRVVHRAFSGSPWVRKVKFASLQSGRNVYVELEYRRPVAAVWVPPGLVPVEGGHEHNGGGGVVPIDDQAICLPGIRQEDADRLPRIFVPVERAPSHYGKTWKDVHVLQAASIVAVVRPIWQECDLYCVRLEAGAFELISHGNRRFIWGNPPGAEQSGEASVENKIDRLRTVSAASGPETVDLRTAAEGNPSVARRRSSGPAARF